jgi:hypothetical protein
MQIWRFISSHDIDSPSPAAYIASLDFETVLRMEPNADLALKGATRIRQALKRMEGK